MLAIIKLLFGIIIALMISIPEKITKSATDYLPFAMERISETDTVESKVFQILETKCNVCHSRRNRNRVFTLDNMSGWSDDVYQQVFIKKRMPKGNKIKLMAEEYNVLFSWIKTIKSLQ